MEIQIGLITGISVGFEVVFLDPEDYGEFNAQKIVTLDLVIIRLNFFF